MENKIAPEMAEQEFERFIDAMDILIDTADLDAEDLTSYKKQKGRIVAAVCSGALVFNEEGEAVYTPCHKHSKYTDPITFHERTGASLMATDRKKKGHDVAKTYAMLADMCKVHPNVFAGLMGKDIKVCEALFALLTD